MKMRGDNTAYFSAFRNGVTMNCTIHKIIKTQTFSIDEMEFLVHHAKEYEVCESCVATMATAIRERTKRDSIIRFSDSMQTGQTRQARTNLPRKIK